MWKCQKVNLILNLQGAARLPSPDNNFLYTIMETPVLVHVSGK